MMEPYTLTTSVLEIGLPTQKTLEGLDDACTELMMMDDAAADDADGDADDKDEHADDAPKSTPIGTAAAPKVLLWSGEAFFETTDDEATAYCEAEVERLQQQLDALEAEHTHILAEQATLKTALYGRFGKSINLEAE
jgi:hypothetical protein